MVHCISFSPTGGTTRIAKYMSTFFGEYSFVDLCDYEADFSELRIAEEDISIIAVPSFRGRAPTLAAKRISRLRGNGSRAILLCVYGNREFDDTLAELQDLAQDAGFHVIAALSAISKHSECPTLAKYRPDDEDFDRLTDFAMQIRAKLDSNDYSCPAIPGNRPYKPDNAVVVPPETTSRCTRCRSCAIMCPAQAISHSNPKVVDKRKCISCMRCVHVCPVKAKHLESGAALKINTFLKPCHDMRKEPELFL